MYQNNIIILFITFKTLSIQLFHLCNSFVFRERAPFSDSLENAIFSPNVLKSAQFALSDNINMGWQFRKRCEHLHVHAWSYLNKRLST